MVNAMLLYDELHLIYGVKHFLIHVIFITEFLLECLHMSYGKGRRPNIGYIKVWRCLAYCKNNDLKMTKLGPRQISCAFGGYVTNNKAHRLLNIKSNVIIESGDVEFFEHLLISRNKSQIPNSGKSEKEAPIDITYHLPQIPVGQAATT